MVRFSDIVKIKGKGITHNRRAETSAQEGAVRPSDAGARIGNRPQSSAKPVLKRNSGLAVEACFEKIVEKAFEVRGRVLNDQEISPFSILSDLDQIIEHDLVDRLYVYALSYTGEYDADILHNVDVTFASLKIGRGLGYERKRLLELGLAAFLENVGMFMIPQSVLNKADKLDESEMDKIVEHPETSSRILSRMGADYEWLANVALQVHERADGSGYPRGLKGPEISEVASIIGLADIYIALIGKRPGRDKLIQTDAIRLILKEAKGLFPHKILKTFLNQVSLFPVNSYVRLNNKSIGRVTSTIENQPLRPTIELIYDGLGNKLERREIVCLTDNPLLYITDSLRDAKVP